jgi:hypothetical protein
VPLGAASGVSGAACGVCGVVVGACGAGEVSDAGGVVVCGVSCGAGACAEVAPAKQSATSAELLRSNKRLLRIDITTPQNSCGTIRWSPDHQHVAASAAARDIGIAVAEARLGRYPRSMSGKGRRARAEGGMMEGGSEIELDRRQQQQSAE